MDIKEFIEKLQRAQNAYPSQAEDALRKGARSMTKALKDNSPDSGRSHRNKLKNSWRMEMEGVSSNDLQANIYSKAPHFHLVDRGHVKKTRNGKVIGYVQGEHFLQKTLDSEGKDIQKKMGEQLLKKLKGEFD